VLLAQNTIFSKFAIHKMGIFSEKNYKAQAGSL